ncbi:MAG: response regulator [Deltaproteobacteria bacterium]|nr:response regulator [Deltaproteobacteria bacterium]
MAHLLNRVEYNVFTVTTSYEMFKVTTGITPHLILLDLRMPLVAGMTCLEKLRSNKGLNAIKVVMVSTAADLPSLKETLKKGAQAYIINPIKPTELYTTIHGLIEPHPRKCLRLRVIFKAAVTSGNMMWRLYATVISENGVFIRTVNPLPEGTSVHLSLELPSPKPIELDGTVVYAVKLDKNSLMEPGMGIKFVNAPEKITHGIRKFIENDLMCEFDREAFI